MQMLIFFIGAFPNDCSLASIVAYPERFDQVGRILLNTGKICTVSLTAE